MLPSELPVAKPKLYHALRLHCPYCGQTPLLKPSNLISFREGCPICNYRYERETGYFAGAAWMITYSLAGLLAMATGAYMIWRYPNASDFVVAGVPALVAALVSFGFIPFGRALWLYIDHNLHPLTQQDCLK
jgi:uncharacterized protein (DUF983 family)